MSTITHFPPLHPQILEQFRFRHLLFLSLSISYLRLMHQILNSTSLFPWSLMSHILPHSHDWSDAYCVRILRALATAMAPHSRILICDQLMIPTLASSDPVIPSAPEPLPANYGASVRFSHQRDLCMMGIINGIERTPDQLKVIVEDSGLRIEKVWECRSQVPIVEVRLADGATNGVNGMNGHHES